jgi:acyl carrier protein
MNNLKEEIVNLIIEISHPNVPDLSDENRPFVDSNMDSLDWASALMAVEEKYNLEISDEGLLKLTTLRTLVEFVENR